MAFSFLTARPWAGAVHVLPVVFFNRAAMGRARFMFYPWFFFFGSFVGDQTQTSLGQTSNDATYGVLKIYGGRMG